MSQDLLEQLKAIDPSFLTEVVRKDQQNPDLIRPVTQVAAQPCVQPICFASRRKRLTLAVSL